MLYVSAIALALVLDIWKGQILCVEFTFKVMKRCLTFIDRIVGIIILVVIYCIAKFTNVRSDMRVIAEYWSSNYRISLKPSSSQNLAKSTMTQFSQIYADPDKLFHAILFAFHLLEFTLLDAATFWAVIQEIDTAAIWGIIEFVAINKSIGKITAELRITNKRYSEDGVFYVDLENLPNAQQLLLPELIAGRIK